MSHGINTLYIGLFSKVSKSREKLWRPTRRAWRRLFHNGWQVAA